MLKPDGKAMTTHEPPASAWTGFTQPSISVNRPQRIAVFVGSIRKDRMGGDIAAWAASRAAILAPEVDLIDLAAVKLPNDELLEPGGGPRSSIADRVERADAFVIVTPEYNHSYPASLKRAIDWHYREWMFKPATVLSYGNQGGLLAGEHLRSVFAELHVVTTRRTVGLRSPWEHLDEDGFQPDQGTQDAFDAALRELHWWADTLRYARTHTPFPS